MDIFNNRPELNQFLKEVTAKNNIKKYKITNVETNQKGEGYLGEIWMITLKDENTTKNFDVIIKVAFQDEKTRNIVPVRLSFENEIFFYSTLLPTYQRFEKEHKITNHRIFTPFCHHVTLNDHTEMLALENLKVSGFETISKKAILDDAHIRMVFENYGRFHAYSFALRDQQPELFSKLTENMHDMFDEFLKVDFFKEILNRLFASLMDYLIPGEDENIINQLHKRYLNENQIIDHFKEAKDSNCKYSAILHGDCWSNNMLFKYQKDDADTKTLVDMRLIDFQIIRVGSPVCDLSYCFYSGASKTELAKLDEYLAVYHRSFSAFLRQLGSDPDQLYPFDALKADWRTYSKFGVMMGMNIMRMKYVEQGDIIDLTDIANFDQDKMAEHFTSTKFDEVTYGRRAREVLQHLITIDAL